MKIKFTRNKRDRVYWTALVGALGRPMKSERGQLLTFDTRKAAVAALIAHEPAAKPSTTL